MAFMVAVPVWLGERGLQQVAGVKQGHMLKMRTGPEPEFEVLLGLPNGAELRVQDCDQTGNPRWRRVSRNEARAI